MLYADIDSSLTGSILRPTTVGKARSSERNGNLSSSAVLPRSSLRLIRSVTVTNRRAILLREQIAQELVALTYLRNL
ncbi:hypothetical protein D7X12_24125 [Corallococcus sicarius]|uniref:Uncharacterized protein n=1 Tax=Corallococcus sicarius TaxID=2316726 RepID=A0A3A8NH05_9BACT|nr:hypothetical protein D7X12_24125 [Corallococcus sicarius]